MKTPYSHVTCSLRPLMTLALGSLTLASCAAPSSGPSASRVARLPQASVPGLENIRIVDVTDATIRQIVDAQNSVSFFDQFGEGKPYGTIVGRGDTIDISIWEAPPAVLFGALGAGSVGSDLVGIGIASRSPGIPEQMVDATGQISIPFVGKVNAAGRTPQQIAENIEARLHGKAHLPQVIVRRIENSTTNVTVVGDVLKSGRIPLTPKGERLLDALASAGGTKQPIGKLVVQLTRGGNVMTMPLDSVIRDPRQNIRLAPDDVVTLLYQPYSFIALGAVGKNSEIPFEGTGMTLAQALGRIGGLEDQRSDPTGIFIFRLENGSTAPNVRVSSSDAQRPHPTPVIYRINLKNPASLFFAQRFPICDHDVLFVSNSPTADIQKFLGLLSQATFSLTGIGSVVP